jgi:hypothetical protein
LTAKPRTILSNPMTATDEPESQAAENCPPVEPSPTAAPEPSRPLPVPTRTFPLLLIFLAAGLLPLIFAFRTVHGRDLSELMSNPNSSRTHGAISHWIERGYWNSRGLICWPAADGKSFTIYRSSTGGLLISGFITEKIYASITGHYSYRLLGLHNQLLTLLTASLIGLLGFRLAVRIGVAPLQALALAISVEIVHFTFPDTLALYWEMSGRECWLLFTTIFLLLEERAWDSRTRRLTIAQAIAVFFLMYMEYIAGAAFLASYLIIHLILGADRNQARRLALVCLAPALLAVAVFAIQLKSSARKYPDHPTYASKFMSRSGMDGSSQYYVDHLDIAFGRAGARSNFPHNREHLFRWQWLFIAGTASLLTVLVAAMKGRVPKPAVIALTSLLGAYLLYAALFSQAVMIHPYLYDVMLLTPLILALFVVLPAVVESITGSQGIAVVFVVFLAVWVSFVQFRHYALRYPLPEKVTSGTVSAGASELRYPAHAPVLQRGILVGQPPLRPDRQPRHQQTES